MTLTTLTDVLSFHVKQPGLRWKGGGRTGKTQMLLSTMSGGPNEFKGQDVLIGKILFFTSDQAGSLQGKLIFSLPYLSFHRCQPEVPSDGGA